MTEEVNEVLGSKKKEPKVDITMSDLQSLVSAITASQDEKLAKALDSFASAIIESRKPYRDPKQLENEEKFKESTRRQREFQIESMKRDQEWCQHLQGSNALSESPGTATSIIRHRLDTSEVIGICTNCGRQFREEDPDYATWMRKTSGNRLSSAGQRNFLDPTAAKRAGR